ncbi:hypothetical protein [Pleomorphomonas sp. NRK KF1]|uniref:hypothetical protein n=1 Tax=Pleomorphomonas sp. NRK KF1 TaxID=2943000 RepID=UPI0020442BFB|nr:hypothetical protein [Pleomorphomonas sp. NRK KF1]MCM5555606.1 hypothetical protein [Pleomorphomonas sp. NRK KF1]
MGPLDILGDSDAGILDEDLRAVCLGALAIDPAAARELALSFSWRRAAMQFLDNVRLANGETLDEAPFVPATA